MGGVAGHLSHLYDNRDLTYNEMANILQKAASGELKGTEKTDGYNIYLGYVDGSARAARNKGDMSRGGMTFHDLLSRTYKGGDKAKMAYVSAFSAYEKAVDSLSEGQKDTIFGPNGDIFYNAEIQGPVAPNVVNYDENIVNDTLSFDMLVIIPTYEDVAAAHHELEGYDTPDETRGAADAGSDTGSRERERPSRDRGDRPDRSRASPDETDKKPWEDKKCPEGHEFGVACTKEAECQTCPEDAYAACLKEADELEKGPETPADEPAPERTRTRTTTASADRPARERTRSR